MVDGYDLFEAFKVLVSEASGLDVMPKVKKREQYDWPDESGVEVDHATELVYEALEINLSCYVFESTYPDAVKRINGLLNLLAGEGLHLLGSSLRKRLYPVLLQEVSGYKRVTKAKAGEVVLEFNLKLLCPLPECRMAKVVTVMDDEEVTITIPTGKDFTIWWGDGTKSDNVLSHEYADAGTYTILMSGTGVTSALITSDKAIIDEYSYPASGDIIHVDISPTSAEAYAKAVEAIGMMEIKVENFSESFNLSADKANTIQNCTSAINVTVSIPLNESGEKFLLLPVAFEQAGNGVVSIVGAEGVTVPAANKTAGQGKMIVLYEKSLNVYGIAGGVE